MKEKTWEAEWRGRTIRVINRTSFLPPRTSEALEVDGKLVAETRSGLTQMFATVREDIDFQGETKPVEARFA